MRAGAGERLGTAGRGLHAGARAQAQGGPSAPCVSVWTGGGGPCKVYEWGRPRQGRGARGRARMRSRSPSRGSVSSGRRVFKTPEAVPWSEGGPQPLRPYGGLALKLASSLTLKGGRAEGPRAPASAWDPAVHPKATRLPPWQPQRF